MRFESFSGTLKDLRNREGVTQEELAELVNVSHKTMSGYEAGYHNPSVGVALDMAELLTVSASEAIPFLLLSSGIPPQVVNGYMLRFTEEVLENHPRASTKIEGEGFEATKVSNKNKFNYEEVAEMLQASIDSGVFSHTLPPEITLCEMTGFSRGTIRKAISILRDKGLVTSKQGIGTLIKR